MAVVVLLLLLTHALAIRVEENRKAVEALFYKIESIEQKVNLDNKVSLFLHQLKLKGYNPTNHDVAK